MKYRAEGSLWWRMRNNDSLRLLRRRESAEQYAFCLGPHLLALEEDVSDGKQHNCGCDQAGGVWPRQKNTL